MSTASPFELVSCPQCGQVASIEWSRTAREMIYLKIHCIARHWFLMPAEHVTYYASDRAYRAARESAGGT